MAPLPVPEAPEAIVNHAALLVAVHAKPLLEAVTDSDPDPPDAGILAVEGLTVRDPKAPFVTVIADGNPSAWRLAALKIDVLEALSTSTTPIEYTPEGLNCGSANLN